ncbi:hypothetical protein IAE33_003689 [Pseudomonas sp. S60]|nr:hypothetical protein [Pseudomonas sp. S32]MBK5011829.1 hypothetical protein [Pseudomonas sp. S60]
MYADHPALNGKSHRNAALFAEEKTRCVDACAFAGLYSAPRFTCDPFAYRALLTTPG